MFELKKVRLNALVLNTNPSGTSQSARVKSAAKKFAQPVAAVPSAKKSEKRISLNPQPILDAKTEALRELGTKLTWAGRKWKAKDREFTSLEMSEYSVEEFTKLFAKA